MKRADKSDLFWEQFIMIYRAENLEMAGQALEVSRRMETKEYRKSHGKSGEDG